MAVGSVTLAQIYQTLDQMQATAPSGSVSGAPPAGQSFAATLSQAAEALSEIEGLSGANPLLSTSTSLPLSSGISSASSANTELNLMEMMLLPQLATASSVTAPPNGAASSAVSNSLASGFPTTGTQNEVVTLASQLEGTPYVWGGTSPSGFDCSGLTQYVYHELGINLPRTSEEQATVGTPVASLSDAQPGDLLFFAGSDGTPTSPGHVAIYAGDGEMIDAPYTGTVVQQQSVATAGPIVAIRRIVPSPTPDAVMGAVTVPGQYAATVEAAAAQNGIPASLLAGLISQESGFNPNAVSSAGAEGIAQFMPGTAAGMGINPFDPVQAINAAAKLIGTYASQFGSYANALAAYNAGPAAVVRYGGVPPYPETQAYVPAVLSLAGLSTSGGTT